MEDTVFTMQDILWALKNWKLKKLSNKEKLSVLDFLIENKGIESNEYAFGENDIESLILEIISED